MGLLNKIRSTKSDPIINVSLLLIAISRLVTFLAYPNPVSAPDSSTYYSGEFWDFSLVSPIGHAARGWVVPLIFSLLPNLICIELFQLTFSALAWSFLLLTLSKTELLAGRVSKCGLLVIGILGSSPQVIQHDTTILATSITNALFVILIALVIKVVQLKKDISKTLLLILAVSVLLSIQKSTFIPIVGILVLISVVTSVKLQSWKFRIQYVGLSLVAALLTLLIGYNVNNSWQVSYSGQTLLWQLGGQSPAAADFKHYLMERGAPSCITDNAPYENLDISIGKILNECPKGAAFVKSRIQSEFVIFAASNPKPVIQLGVFGIGASLTSSASNYGNAVAISPQFLDELFFGTTSPNITESIISDQVEGLNFLNSGAAFWIHAPLLVWLLLAGFGIVFGLVRTRNDLILFLIAITSLGQAFFAVVLLPSEWVRQTVPFVLSALITSIIIVLRSAEIVFGEVANSDR